MHNDFPDDRFERELAVYEQQQWDAELEANTVQSSTQELVEMSAKWLLDFFLDNDIFWDDSHSENNYQSQELLTEKMLWQAEDDGWEKVGIDAWEGGLDDWAGSVASYFAVTELLMTELKAKGFPLAAHTVVEHAENLHTRLLADNTCQECGQDDWNKTQKQLLTEILAQCEKERYNINDIRWELKTVNEDFAPLFSSLYPKCSVHNPEPRGKSLGSGDFLRKGEKNNA